MERFIQQQIPMTPTRSVPEAPCPACGVQSLTKKNVGDVGDVGDKNVGDVGGPTSKVKPTKKKKK